MDRKGFIKSLSLLMTTPIVTKADTVLNELGKTENTERMPVIFIGHGNPMYAIQTNSFTKARNNF